MIKIFPLFKMISFRWQGIQVFIFMLSTSSLIRSVHLASKKSEVELRDTFLSILFFKNILFFSLTFCSTFCCGSRLATYFYMIHSNGAYMNWMRVVEKEMKRKKKLNELSLFLAFAHGITIAFELI